MFGFYRTRKSKIAAFHKRAVSYLFVNLLIKPRVNFSIRLVKMLKTTLQLLRKRTKGIDLFNKCTMMFSNTRPPIDQIPRLDEFMKGNSCKKAKYV